MSDATWDDAQLGRGHINGGVAVGIANRWSRRKCTYDGDVSTYTGVKLAKIQQACSEKRNGRGFGGEEMGAGRTGGKRWWGCVLAVAREEKHATAKSIAAARFPHTRYC